jgi:hypothetical protein
MATLEQLAQAREYVGLASDYRILKDIDSTMSFLGLLAGKGRVSIIMSGSNPVQARIFVVIGMQTYYGRGRFREAVDQIIGSLFPTPDIDPYLVEVLIDTYAPGKYDTYADKMRAAAERSEMESKALEMSMLC